MRFSLFLGAAALLLTLLPAVSRAQEVPHRDRAFYEPDLKDPVLKEIRERYKKWKEDRDAETGTLRESQEAARKKKKDDKIVLRASLPESELPGAPDTFVSSWHMDAQAQYMTGTCWAFAATSYLESEAFRISGRKVKMSEMHTVYFEYLEKARRFVRERGDSHFAEGSEHNAVTRMWKLYGAVPLAAYKGVVAEDGRHDHMRLSREMTDFLQFVKEKDLWDEEWVLAVIRTILDKYLGPPPTEFAYEGKKYTPKSFVAKVLEVDPDDYVGFMSTMATPFFAKGKFEVSDNWWQDGSYHNVPVELFMETLSGAVKGGYTVAIGGDVSEPGKNYRQDLAFVPTFDIPQDYIDQSAREYRISNGSTGDDHGIHLVGWKEVAGKLWFLIKDSGRSARHGKYEGYYFFREDFVKLKMLTFMVHRGAVAPVLKRFEEPKKKKAKKE